MNAHKTYAKVQRETLSGRDIEAQVLRKAAAQFRQAAAAPAGTERDRLIDVAVRYNLRVWDIFHADWERPDSPLSPELRTNLLRLSIYVHKTSLEVLAYAGDEKIKSLIHVNECLVQGLIQGGRNPNAAALATAGTAA